MATSTSISTRSSNHERSMPDLEIQGYFDKVVKKLYPELEANGIYCPLEVNKRYGDFAYYGVLDICNQLREDDPDLFEHTSPVAIAREINQEFKSRKFPMIRTLYLHEAGILTFSIEGSWIAEKINNMLKFDNGINTWAPALYDEKRGKALFVLPSNLSIASELVRASYIKDALENVFSYSGAQVDHGNRDDKAMRMTNACFQKKQGKIVSKLQETSFNEPIDVDVFADLATLWYGVKRLKADVMVYMTPHRLRGYIEHCHNAAANEGWLPHDWEKRGTLTCCGFRAFGHEQQTMTNLLARMHQCEPAVSSRLKELYFGAEYGFDEFFECSLKFACLKSHRLAECLFKFEDIVNEEGYTLASLLKTQAFVRSFIKNSSGRDFTLHALTGKERELGLHILKFTEVIEEVCTAFVPHVLCKYVYDLSELFTSCCCEVKRRNNTLGLCKATQVVIEKCIQLLGIHPSSCMYRRVYECEAFFNASEETLAVYRRFQPYEDASRTEHPNARLEIFTLHVDVADSKFEKGSLNGVVRVLDTCRLANGCGWVKLDANDDCYVSYLDKEWYDAVPINNGSFIALGNPSSFHSIPFSSCVKVELLIYATSEENDRTYLLSNRNLIVDFKSFWDGPLNAQCGAFEFDYEDEDGCISDGCISLAYVAIKDAVDTTMQLTFEPIRDVQLSGSITASYGKQILQERGFLGDYTAQIFIADPKTTYTRREKPYLLTLYKSALAVPVNEYLEMQADLVVGDDTCRLVVDEQKDINVSGTSEGDKMWRFGCDMGVFELSVQRGSSQVKV